MFFESFIEKINIVNLNSLLNGMMISTRGYISLLIRLDVDISIFLKVSFIVSQMEFQIV